MRKGIGECRAIMLTTGVDAITGTAGNDTINGTGTTLTALDGIDGGNGTDTLVIRDAAGVMGTTAPAGMTIAVEKIDINTAGALGQVTAASQAAQKEIDTVTFTTIDDATDATVTYTVVWNGVTVTTAARDNTATAAEAGTLVANAINAIAGSTVATVVGSQVVITAPVAGTALPAYSITSSDGADVITIADSQANQAAVAGSTAAVYDFSGVTGLTDVTAKAAGNVNVKLADTTDASITTTTGSVTVDGGKVVTTSGATGAVAITGAAGLTSASVTGATTVTIADNGTEADTLATVSISGATGASTVASDALTKLTVANSNQNVTVTAAAATRALDLTVNKLTGGTIQDAEATSLALTSTGTASTGVTVSTAKATTISVAGDKAVSFALAGTGASQAANLAITVTNTAGATITTQLDNDVSFTGAAGDDKVTIGATTKAVNVGDGNNTVTIATGVTTIGTGGTVTAGAGTQDVLSMAAADAATATADATAKAAFADKISGFERLTLGDAAASAEVKLNNLDNIQYVNVGDVANAQTLTLSGVATGFTLNANSGTTGTGAVAVALATDGAVGTTDVLNVGISNSTAKDLQALTANKFETINFTSDDTATTPAGGFLHIVSALSADAVKTISVTGDAGFNLGYTGTTATTVDASGITKGGFTWTAGALAASSVVKGTAAGTNTINLDATTTASTFVTYTGGSGNDLVDASSSNNNNVFSLLGGDNNLQSGNGNNTVTLASDGAVAVSNGATGNSITLGNGNNTVTDTGTKGAYVSVGTGSNTITLGSGNDFVTVGAAAGLNVINVGSGTDTVVIGGVQAAGGYYTSITGFGAGDVLNLAAVTATAAADAALGAKITLGANASFANYLDAAAAGTIADNGAAVIKWFQFSGNTYVVVDTETGAGVDGNTFQDGVDSVVELVGLIDLTTSATVSDVLTLA
jgi:S-layer protein